MPLNPKRSTHARNAGEFFVGKEIVARHPVESLGGHAIGATEIATIGHRDTQIAMNATKSINKGHGRQVMY